MPTLNTPQYGRIAQTEEERQGNRLALQEGLRNIGTQSTVQSGNVVPILSSNAGRTTIDENIRDHQLDTQPKDTTVVEDDKTRKKPKKDPAMESVGAITVEEAIATGADLNKYTYDTNTSYFILKSSTGEKDVNKRYDDAEKEVENSFSTFTVGLDKITQDIINSYKNTFSQRIAEEKKLTDEVVQSASSLNTRLGITRYAPNQARGVITDIERQGLDRIRKIGVEETQAIAEAQQHLADKQYDAFISKRNELKDLRRERMDKLSEIQKEENKKIEEQKKMRAQSSRDSAIADLVDQGITDASTILNFLNFDDQGNRIGDVTADEVDKALKIFKPDDSLAGLDQDYRTYKYLSDIEDPAVKGLTYMQYVAAISNTKRKPESPDSEDEKPITLSGEKKTKLLGAGFSQVDITNIEKDVRENGLDAVLEDIEDDDQKDALKQAYGADKDETKLSRESVSRLYNIPDDDDQSSFLGIEYGDTNKDKLDSLMSFIERYREVGYSDKEILKLIEDSQE